jgi:hypothetical protein
MKTLRFVAPAFALVALTAVKSHAQSGGTADQSVTLEVKAINEIAFNGSPSITINSASAGGAPVSQSANATYDITTNETNKKVTASLDADLPAGFTLSASLAAPSGATSAGAVDLGFTGHDVVTGISTVSATGLNVTYTLTATAAAGVLPSATHTVTYTIVAGA